PPPVRGPPRAPRHDPVPGQGLRRNRTTATRRRCYGVPGYGERKLPGDPPRSLHDPSDDRVRLVTAAISGVPAAHGRRHHGPARYHLGGELRGHRFEEPL